MKTFGTLSKLTSSASRSFLSEHIIRQYAHISVPMYLKATSVTLLAEAETGALTCPNWSLTAPPRDLPNMYHEISTAVSPAIKCWSDMQQFRRRPLDASRFRLPNWQLIDAGVAATARTIRKRRCRKYYQVCDKIWRSSSGSWESLKKYRGLLRIRILIMCDWTHNSAALASPGSPYPYASSPIQEILNCCWILELRLATGGNSVAEDGN